MKMRRGSTTILFMLIMLTLAGCKLPIPWQPPLTGFFDLSPYAGARVGQHYEVIISYNPKSRDVRLTHDDVELQISPDFGLQVTKSDCIGGNVEVFTNSGSYCFRVFGTPKKVGTATVRLFVEETGFSEALSISILGENVPNYERFKWTSDGSLVAQ